MKINPTSLTINQLFGSSNEQYVIPSYQRRYSWHERQVWELIEDVELIEGVDTHLLGSIVCLANHHTAGINRLELVDGQQRLTTVTILLECIKQRLERENESGEAAAVGGLLSAKPLGGKSLRKVSLDSIDAIEFERLLQGDESAESQNNQLQGAFQIARRWVDEQDLEKLASFLYRLKNQAIVIRLDVSEAKDAFKLFETINNRGLRLSPTDIIKNFLLGNAARFGDDALDRAQKAWTKIVANLDGTNSDAFFRYYLMTVVEARVTASEVVANFKNVFMTQVKEATDLPERHLYPDVAEPDEDELGDAADASGVKSENVALKKVSFKVFLESLVLNAKVYGELTLAQTSDIRINRHLRNLRMIKAFQTYGFLMHLRSGGCDDKAFRSVLKLTESFVLRRHICRERANETEALFARLCSVDPANAVHPTKEAYRELCPSDEKFRDEFAATAFPGNLIERARYCLEQLEIAKQGNYAELQVLGAEDVHVEHIIPQKIKTKRAKDEYGDWPSYLGANAEVLHSKFVGRIGNLTLFAGLLNIGASNNPFQKKKGAYRESAISLTKDLVQYSNFKFRNVEKRSAELAAAAVTIWPMP